jgi:hypothetical protein
LRPNFEKVLKEAMFLSGWLVSAGLATLRPCGSHGAREVSLPRDQPLWMLLASEDPSKSRSWPDLDQSSITKIFPFLPIFVELTPIFRIEVLHARTRYPASRVQGSLRDNFQGRNTNGENALSCLAVSKPQWFACYQLSCQSFVDLL